MGWFDGQSEVGSSSSHHKHHSSSSHKKHRSSSIFGDDKHSSKHNSSRASFFGLGDEREGEREYKKRNSSMASFFGMYSTSHTFVLSPLNCSAGASGMVGRGSRSVKTNQEYRIPKHLQNIPPLLLILLQTLPALRLHPTHNS